MKAYWEKLKDPRWQRKRLGVMQRADFRCECCDASDRTLNVHHKLYRKGANPWDYTDDELACLCEPCHEKLHQKRARLDQAIVRFLDSGLDIEMLMGFADGMWVCLHPHMKSTQLEVTSEEYALGLAAAMRDETGYFEPITEQKIYDRAVEQLGVITVDELWTLTYGPRPRPM